MFKENALSQKSLLECNLNNFYKLIYGGIDPTFRFYYYTPKFLFQFNNHILSGCLCSEDLVLFHSSEFDLRDQALLTSCVSKQNVRSRETSDLSDLFVDFDEHQFSGLVHVPLNFLKKDLLHLPLHLLEGSGVEYSIYQYAPKKV